ncbi:MAG: SH3 domain-containing protein [Myxococcaceae bacterium]|nr:SH3 domain-containing protein [Myxococcaceae bacterium]
MRTQTCLLAAVSLCLACGTAELEVAAPAADEPVTGADALTGNVAIGSTLETTDALNLRSQASTSSTVLRVMPAGARVTTLERSTPSNGFYRVRHQGIAGWAHGAWLKLTSSGCGDFAGYTVFNCSADGRSRLKCSNGVLVTETCASGCSVMPDGTDDRCSTDATPQLDTIAEANTFFVNQWGPTAFTSGGAPYGYSDCVPTSGLMVLGALGLVPHPSPTEALGAIDRIRDLALGWNSSWSQPMNISQLDAAFRFYGAPAGTWRGTQVSALDGIFQRGHFAVAAGGPWPAWGSALNAQGKYLNFSDPGPHAVAVLGKTSSGGYLLADPLSTSGTITVTASQLTTFFSSGYPGIYEYSR